MATLVLSGPQQGAMRSLMASEPVPGSPLPERPVLRDLATALRCDAVHVALVDPPDLVLQAVQLPRAAPLLPLRLPGPPGLGLRRSVSGACPAVLVVGFPSGPAHRIDLTLLRRRPCFDEADVALLNLLEPVVARLVRETAAPHLPGDLTAQERRVLQLVAGGSSNAEIAEHLGIAPSTVRKHLEHAFPKLGVSNRLGAALAFGAHDRIFA